MVRQIVFALALFLLADATAAAPNTELDAPPELAILEPARRVAGGESAEIPLSNLEVGRYYGVLVYLPEFAPLGEADRLFVRIEDAAGIVTEKALHAADTDLYITLKPRKSGAGKITGRFESGAAGASIEFRVQTAPMRFGNNSPVIAAALPNSDWRTAQPIELGRTVFGSNDERPYIAFSGAPSDQLRDMFAGAQWFTFTWAGPNSALVHFDVNTLDRDIPDDVALFTVTEKDGRETLAPFTEGVERFVPEKSTAFHGLFKLIARTVKPGTYYLRVMGNHPDWQLRTRVYNPPPYDDPREAVRTGMDYLIKKGDSWHMNTPRRGGVAMRQSNPLQETSLCIACHPTHFTTRGELTAVENGYPVKERTSLQFLTERLYNNPRPIYGKPDAAWVRMISAPGNVMSRLAYMLFTFERNVSREQREGLLDDIGNYLEMYWKELDYIHPESNGNQPRVSGFEIALHNGLLFAELYRRTGESKWRDLRGKMERLAVEGEVQDHIDLCWKGVALATFDPVAHRAEMDKVITEIFSRQREDGTWAMPFGTEVYEHDYRRQKTSSREAPLDKEGRPVASEFQTYHCIYALAKMGVTMEDPRLAKAVNWCLAQQKPFGGWQGNKDYKNFDTPFRDTQYAVMALSELFKGPGGNGWMAGYPDAPKTFDLRDTGETLAALDQYWDDPGPETRALIRRALHHEQPLVRQAACAAVGRLADAEAVSELARLLGDPSKIVQRSAAWAMRQIMTRRQTGDAAVLAALQSSDDRARWGAARVFNQHFRYMADRWDIAQVMMKTMENDPAPAVRMAAAQAMWKWFYWLRDDAQKSAVEDGFISAMARPEHTHVRRNLIEGFHNLVDDNVGYLYNSWVRQLSAEADRNVVTEAHHASVKRQADKIAAVLTNGNDLQRDGVLRSFYTFHLRESGGDDKLVADVPTPEFAEGDWVDGYRKYAAYDPLKNGTGVMGRIGNDSDFPTFYADSAPIIAAGLLNVLQNASPELRTGALLTLKHTAGIEYDAPMSNQLLAMAMNAPGEDAEQVRRLVRELLPTRIENSAAVAGNVGRLISEGDADVIDVGVAILTDDRNTTLAQDAGLAATVKARVLGLDLASKELPLLNNILARMEPLQNDRDILDKSFAALVEGPTAARKSAARAMITGPKFLLSGAPRERFQAELNVADEPTLTDLLSVVGAIDFAKLGSESSQNLALGIVTTALSRPETAVRKKGLDVVRTMTTIQQNPAVLSQIKTLSTDADKAVAESAGRLLDSIKVRGGAAKDQDLTQLLDYAYYRKNIEVIFQAKGGDSEACAECHMNHSILKLNYKPSEGELSEDEIRANYLAALRVVDLNNPEESLILVKPRMPFEGIELPGNYRKTHGGNLRWTDGTEQAEYKTILQWIQGAKVEAEVSFAP